MARKPKSRCHASGMAYEGVAYKGGWPGGWVQAVPPQSVVTACIDKFKSCHVLQRKHMFITGPPNGPVLVSLLSSVVVCNAAGGPGACAFGRPTLHSRPLRLRPVRATPCFVSYTWTQCLKPLSSL